VRKENEALACRFLTDSNGEGAGWGRAEGAFSLASKNNTLKATQVTDST
jgi:hypothetical protein